MMCTTDYSKKESNPFAARKQKGMYSFVAEQSARAISDSMKERGASVDEMFDILEKAEEAHYSLDDKKRKRASTNATLIPPKKNKSSERQGERASLTLEQVEELLKCIPSIAKQVRYTRGQRGGQLLH